MHAPAPVPAALKPESVQVLLRPRDSMKQRACLVVLGAAWTYGLCSVIGADAGEWWLHTHWQLDGRPRASACALYVRLQPVLWSTSRQQLGFRPISMGPSKEAWWQHLPDAVKAACGGGRVHIQRRLALQSACCQSEAAAQLWMSRW